MKNRALHWFVCLVTFGAIRLTMADPPAASSPPVDLRVGIISYDLPEDKIKSYQALFDELTTELAEEKISAKPSFAVGTYADVLDWVSRGLVDVAVLSPSAFAETREAHPIGADTKSVAITATESDIPDCTYIATEGKVPADFEAWASDTLKWSALPGRCRFEYNSVCIVCAESKIKTFADIEAAAKRGEIQFVFGDPLSASSAILPMHVLHSRGIDFKSHMEYTFGQSDSVNLMREMPELITHEGKTLTRVAFVFDLALRNSQENQNSNQGDFRPIDIELSDEDKKLFNANSMKDITLPMEVWVARKDFDNTSDQKKIQHIRDILKKHVAHRTSSLFVDKEITNSSVFLEHLENGIMPTEGQVSQALSEFLRDKLSSLIKKEGLTSEEQNQAVKDALNEIIQAGPFVNQYANFRNQHVPKEILKGLKDEVDALKAQNPPGNETNLNRLILRNAYPELAGKHSREIVPGSLPDFKDHSEYPDQLKQRFFELRRWAQEVRAYLSDSNPSDSNSENPGMRFPVRFEDILSLVDHYDFIHNKDGRKGRLALVLAGGGAKCAYEAGVAVELEKQIENWQNTRRHRPGSNKEPIVDIDLVVGTSGGALNAVPIAAGMAKPQMRGSSLGSTWKDLNAFDILRPPPLVQLALGICYAFAYFILVRAFAWSLVNRHRPWVRVIGALLTLGAATFLAALLFPTWMKWLSASKWKWLVYVMVTVTLIGAAWVWTPRHQPNQPALPSVRLVAVLLIFFPFVCLVLFCYPRILTPFPALGSKSLFYPILILGCGVFSGATICIFWGGLVLANEHLVNRPGQPTGIIQRIVNWANVHFRVSFWQFFSLATVLVIVAGILAAYNKTGLFNAPPLEKAVTNSYTRLFGCLPNLSIEELNNANLEKRREKISSAVFQQIKNHGRDLVVTGSSLTKESRGAKYFYVRAEKNGDNKDSQNDSSPVRFGTRGIEIAQAESDKLVDIAIGSGTMFPIFPSHPVYNLAHQEKMDLIDGGFAHNSPVEAAVSWGATHIILIEVSPEAKSKGDVQARFYQNAMTAFNYLYDQAQTADVNAKEEAAVFMLRPTEPENGEMSVSLFDFGSKFADHQLGLGSDDASCRRFVRQPAVPHFWAAQTVK